MVRFNLDMFSYDKDEKLLSQEASTLELDRVSHSIAVYSPTTQRTVLFYLKQQHADSEGELTHSEYATTDPAFKGGKLIIWND